MFHGRSRICTWRGGICTLRSAIRARTAPSAHAHRDLHTRSAICTRATTSTRRAEASGPRRSSITRRRVGCRSAQAAITKKPGASLLPASVPPESGHCDRLGLTIDRHVEPHEPGLRTVVGRSHLADGTASRIDRVDVRWPSGSIESLQNLPANERVTVTEEGVTSRTPFAKR
jgi:hypothetical protein